jgi:anti-sigma28 factor (negative regulator of flagellin synthesis)
MMVKIDPEKALPSIGKKNPAAQKEKIEFQTKKSSHQPGVKDTLPGSGGTDDKETTLNREDSRTKKLAALKQQIGAGKYQPDLDKVAGSLLKHLGKS